MAWQGVISGKSVLPVKDPNGMTILARDEIAGNQQAIARAVKRLVKMAARRVPMRRGAGASRGEYVENVIRGNDWACDGPPGAVGSRDPAGPPDQASAKTGRRQIGSDRR